MLGRLQKSVGVYCNANARPIYLSVRGEVTADPKKALVLPYQIGDVKLDKDVIEFDDANKGDKPFVLGLSTGRTPLGLYTELVNRYKAGKVSFANVVVYSLDEFYPMAPESPQSRNHRVYEDFLKYIDINPANVHFPDGTVASSEVN